jgi:predicted nucleotidyltransferase
MGILTEHFQKHLELLNRHGVKYLIIGGYAVAAHGHPRATKDLDIFYEKDQINALSLVEALKEMDVPGADVTLFMEKDAQIMFGEAPDTIDFLGDLPGVSFEECWARRVELKIDGLSVPFISREDLIFNKKASGRLQDLADVEAIIKTDALPFEKDQ